MHYTDIIEGKFLSRPNRFIAHVDINGSIEVCHVKNTGRCKELFVPGAAVFLQKSSNPNRKTKYDLITVIKNGILINVDSQIPNAVAAQWIENGGLFPDVTYLKREKTYGNSRFDLYVETPERKAFIEVKGVTLENEGLACFPDAPTERGVKHVQELCKCINDGYEAYILFVIQMKGVRSFSPNWKTHPAFGEALLAAEKAGVHILAYDCDVTKDSIFMKDVVPVLLATP